MNTERRDSDPQDAVYPHHRREDATGTWVRWALVLMLGVATSALGFVVQLSNRMTAVETKIDTWQDQRKEYLDAMSKLTIRVETLDRTIIDLTAQLKQIDRVPPRQPSRMFDK